MRARESANVLVFGGTTEGRVIVERLCARPGVQVCACTATEYGAAMVEPRPNLRMVAERLDEPAMEALMRSRPFLCAVDATHPYAAEVSANAAAAARASGLELVRVVREGEPEGPWTGASTPERAAAIVARRKGNILLTTGSKDLLAYVRAVPDFRERLFVRVLPTPEAVQKANVLGVPGKHIIAMQGPFSYGLNCALIRDLDISWLVTKASGRAGGFWEKVRAAKDCGCGLVVLHRPVHEEGLSLEDACERIAKILDAAEERAERRRATIKVALPGDPGASAKAAGQSEGDGL